MDSNALSSVIEKQIGHLCLKDFPCGRGSWVSSEAGTEGGGTEETDALLDLLTCSHSPWTFDGSWSPQAAALRRMAVLSPERLNDDCLYSNFTALRVMDKDVSVIDKGLLKFSKLEELVLSVNRISEVSSENLPRTLKTLELRANCLSTLDGLTRCPPPHLRYLGLGSNSLRSQEDVSRLTGRHWPQLVCLDLSDCEFEEQPALLKALRTLPSLRTLVLQGNPLALASCYPGLAVESLPQLSCLDASWISPDERQSFKGLAKMSGLVTNQASVTVSVGRMRGTTGPVMSVNQNSPDFPFVTYSYFITYEIPGDKTPNYQKCKSESDFDGRGTEHEVRDADLQSNKNSDKETLRAETCDLKVDTEEVVHDAVQELRRSTAKLMWSECMDFSDTQMCKVSDLGGLKRFLNLGLHLRIEEEKVTENKVTSAPDEASAKTSKSSKMKGTFGKESSIKSGSNKEKSKDKTKTSVPALHACSRRVLGSVHVPLHSLVRGGRHVNVLCDFGALHPESAMEAHHLLEKELGKKMKVEKEDEESKRRGDSGPQQKRTSASKAKGKGGKGCEDAVVTDHPVSDQPEAVTVELRVELERWQSASEGMHGGA
ncbi:leucine-rich repeat-containing protein 43-like [Brachionichthys hirsutus]|uniref:leucine-rich repeat-containing protein 43-like n=1 Tax=Brachionichthys hirsutus TaxID=412623 RepID=UPI0036052CE2